MSTRLIFERCGYEGETICDQIRGAVEPSEVGVALPDLWPEHVREVHLGLFAIAGERTDDLEVQYRAVRFRKTAGNFLGEGLDIAGFTIPLRQEVLGVIAIEVVIARLEGHGLAE